MQQTKFYDRKNHVEVVTVEDGKPYKFWVTKSRLAPGKDGRLYGHHGKYTLAVEPDKSPEEYTLLMRREAGRLLLPNGAERGRLSLEQRKVNRAAADERNRQAKIEHVGNLLLLCGVGWDRWLKVEAEIGVPPCEESDKKEWIGKLCDVLNLRDKEKPLTKVMGCG